MRAPRHDGEVVLCRELHEPAVALGLVAPDLLAHLDRASRQQTHAHHAVRLAAGRQTQEQRQLFIALDLRFFHMFDHTLRLPCREGTPFIDEGLVR